MREPRPPVPDALRMALANGVATGDMREAILQSAIEAGHTGSLRALKRSRKVWAEPEAQASRVEAPVISEPPVASFGATANGMDAALLKMWSPLMPVYWSRAGLSQELPFCGSCSLSGCAGSMLSNWETSCWCLTTGVLHWVFTGLRILRLKTSFSPI